MTLHSPSLIVTVADSATRRLKCNGARWDGPVAAASSLTYAGVLVESGGRCGPSTCSLAYTNNQQQQQQLKLQSMALVRTQHTVGEVLYIYICICIYVYIYIYICNLPKIAGLLLWVVNKGWFGGVRYMEKQQRAMHNGVLDAHTVQPNIVAEDFGTFPDFPTNNQWLMTGKDKKCW